MDTLKVGLRVPKAKLARIVKGALETVKLENLLGGRRVILVGLPGAFTPICSGKHLPDLIANAPRLKAAGIDEIICVAPNSPWVMDEWSRAADPDGKLTFLSDGNAEFTRDAGMLTRAPWLHMGTCSKRYTVIVKDGLVEKLAVEDQIEVFNCTRPAKMLD